MLDQYLIERTIGEGGAGVVVQARHKTADRVVAIKMLANSLIADETSLQRFQREAKTLCSLDHPHIVKVFSFGISEDDRPFFVMEYLEGKTLSETLKESKRLDLHRFESIFTQVCSALSYAHKQGIVHRDIKPANIMLQQEVDDHETAKLLDFGIARKQEAEDGPGSKLTQTGTLIGSPAYMSPEQCRGQKPDTRSDIYSLGCVMYECLSGHPPFTSENVAETLMNHLNVMPPPMETMTDAGLLLSPSLIELVISCLAKDPEKRPASAEEISQRLQAACHERPISLSKSSQKRKQRTAQILVAAAGLVLLVPVVIAAINTFQHNKRMLESTSVDSSWITVDRTIAQADNDFDKDKFADAILGYEHAIKLASKLEKGKSKPSPKAAGRLLKCYKQLTRCRTKYQGFDPDALTTWRQTLECAIIIRGQPIDVAEAEFELANLISQSQNPSEKDLAEAEKLIKHSIEYYERRIDAISASPMVRERSKGHLLSEEGRYAADMSVLALIYERTGRYPEALTQLEKASAVDKKILGERGEGHTLSTLQTMARFCRLYRKTGEKEKETKALNDLLGCIKTNQPPVPAPAIVGVLSELTNFYIAEKDLQTASAINELFREEAIKRRASTAKASSLCDQARILLRQGKRNEALKIADKARQILDNCPAQYHPIPCWQLLLATYLEADAKEKADYCAQCVARIEGKK